MLKIREASLNDLNFIVDIHIRAFPGFFLTLMGRRFLRQFYRCFFYYPDGICIAACKDEKIFGFAAGAFYPDKFFRLIKRRRFLAFGIAALPAIFLRPHKILRKLFLSVFRNSEALPTHLDAALLSSVAVAPEQESKGIGQQLVSAFCQKVQEKGINAVYLTTDRDNNDRVNKFYQQLGFSLENTFMQYGKRVMNLYVIRFNS